MGGWDDYGYYEQEAAKELFIEDTLRGISEDAVRSYLGQNGDAIDERVCNCIRQAKELHDSGFFQPAVVSATHIVLPIAERLGFTLEATGFWCGSKTANSGVYFTPRNPF